MGKHIISVLSHKGGGGKTTTSHLLAYGLSKLGHGVIHAATDSIRSVRDASVRPYNTYSAKTDEELKTVVASFSKFPDVEGKELFLVLDGGANKHELDVVLAKASDLVLIPFKDSYEDYEAAALDLRRLPDAFGLKTAWPYEYKRIPIANAEMEEEFGDLKNRLFNYTITYSENLRLITNDKKIDSLVKARPIAKNFALATKHHFGLNVRLDYTLDDDSDGLLFLEKEADINEAINEISRTERKQIMSVLVDQKPYYGHLTSGSD